MRTSHFLFILFCLCTTAMVAQNKKELFKEKQFITAQDTLNYRILYPKNFDDSKQYPVVLFLHGAGERGNDNQAQLVHGSNVFLNKKNRNKFPAIVIFPQCPKDSYWSSADVDRGDHGVTLKFKDGGKPTQALQSAIDLLDDTLNKSYAKKDQVYVAGLSMGGMGTFEILWRKPNTFAAAIAICGGGSTVMASSYAQNTPMWIIHGAKDDVVNPKHSLDMTAALLEAGAYPRVTVYENANHNSWDPAFAEPDFLPWLFNHKSL